MPIPDSESITLRPGDVVTLTREGVSTRFEFKDIVMPTGLELGHQPSARFEALPTWPTTEQIRALGEGIQHITGVTMRDDTHTIRRLREIIYKLMWEDPILKAAVKWVRQYGQHMVADDADGIPEELFPLYQAVQRAGLLERS